MKFNTYLNYWWIWGINGKIIDIENYQKIIDKLDLSPTSREGWRYLDQIELESNLSRSTWIIKWKCHIALKYWWDFWGIWTSFSYHIHNQTKSCHTLGHAVIENGYLSLLFLPRCAIWQRHRKITLLMRKPPSFVAIPLFIKCLSNIQMVLILSLVLSSVNLGLFSFWYFKLGVGS